MKFKAPKHVSAVHTFAGIRMADEQGIISVPDDATSAEIDQLQRAGCSRVIDEAAPAPSGEVAKPKA